MPPVDASVLERLRSALSLGPPLRLAVLFGSRAEGRARPESDYDVGILPAHPEHLSMRDEMDLAARLSSATNAEIDLVRLDRDDPLLGREVARSGICLFERDPGSFARYRAIAASQWMDFEEVVGPHRTRFLQRLSARPAGARGSRRR